MSAWRSAQGDVCSGKCLHMGGGVCLGRGTCLGGVCLGVSAQGVYTPLAYYLLGYTSSVNRLTDRCKNITLPQTSFAGSNNAAKSLQYPVLKFNISGQDGFSIISIYVLLISRIRK